MKSILPLITIALLLGAASCTDLLDPSLRDAGQVIPEGASLTIGFGVPAEISTKASYTDMASDPTIESIHVFVFDDEGTLLQVRKATVGNSVTANYDDENVTSSMTSSWYVDNILMSAEKRVLHFVANLSDDQIPTSGSETSIFQSLSVDKPKAAYWQRIELNSILPYKYKGDGEYSYVDDSGVFQEDKPVKMYPETSLGDDDSYTDENGYTVRVGEYIDRQSRKIVNGTGYYADETVSAKLKLVPLVRNFARIEFTNSWSSFTVRKIALAYEPLAGLVAPFNAGFASEYVNLTAGQEPNMNSSTYTPLLPAAGVNTVCPTDFIDVEDDQKATLFIYERGIPTTENPTCVLIGGNFDGSDAVTTWFKIEIADTDGAYFKIYRDCTYLMDITSIDATATRYTSAQLAFNNVPIGDISKSKETATLTQITDGTGLTLWVNYIDYLDMTGDRDYPLLYTFFYENENNNVTYFPDKVTLAREQTQGSTLGWATTATIEKLGIISSSSNSDYMGLRPDDHYTWYLAMVHLNSKGDDILQSDVVVTGSVKATDGVPRNMTLSRRVTYTVMNQQELGLEATPLAVDAADNQTTVTITLPNTLGPSVFPLTLKIEAEDNNLTPVDNLTVETGPSSFNPSKNSYYFLKTFSYTEYQALASDSYTFNCTFKTTKSTGKTPVTNIRVTEKLAENETRESLFKGGDDATVELKALARQVTRSFTLSNNTSITVTDSDHTGATVTLTRTNINYNNGGYFEANNNNNCTLVFTRTATDITITGIKLTWTEAGRRPTSPINISGGATESISFANTATECSWSGESTGNLTATMTRRTGYNSNFRINSITVTYTYPIDN